MIQNSFKKGRNMTCSDVSSIILDLRSNLLYYVHDIMNGGDTYRVYKIPMYEHKLGVYFWLEYTKLCHQ